MALAVMADDGGTGFARTANRLVAVVARAMAAPMNAADSDGLGVHRVHSTKPLQKGNKYDGRSAEGVLLFVAD